MRKAYSYFIFALLLLSLISEHEIISQARWKPYINGGYVTSLIPTDEMVKNDNGGSVRLGVYHRGVFANGRLGFYAGYLWYNKHYIASIEYDDRGRILIGGLDLLLLKREGMQFYFKAGLGREQLISYYPARKETENSLVPDFGILIDYKHINFFTGWQPSEPSHFNIGIGITL